MDGLSSNESLTRLDISRNRIGDDCGYSLAQNLAKNKTLKFIVLADNHLTIRSCRSIINALHNHPSVHHINLMRNQLSLNDCKQLLDIVEWQNQNCDPTYHIILSTPSATNVNDNDEKFLAPLPEEKYSDDLLQVIDIILKFRSEVNASLHQRFVPPSPSKLQDESSIASVVEQRIDEIVIDKKPQVLQKLQQFPEVTENQGNSPRVYLKQRSIGTYLDHLLDSTKLQQIPEATKSQGLEIQNEPEEEPYKLELIQIKEEIIDEQAINSINDDIEEDFNSIVAGYYAAKLNREADQDLHLSPRSPREKEIRRVSPTQEMYRPVSPILFKHEMQISPSEIKTPVLEESLRYNIRECT
jgi:hypothetical protein